jgi:hypothetical protein
MKLKTLKIWLFLLPMVGILGIVLYVQSNKNREELEAQNIRSISAIEEDIKRALPDFYARVDAFFIRKGYAEFATDSLIRRESIKISDRINFELDYQNARFDDPTTLKEGNLTFRSGQLIKENLLIKLSDEDFANWNIELPNRLKINSPRDKISKPGLAMDLKIDIKDLLRKQENNKIFERFLITDAKGMGIYPEFFEGLQIFYPKENRSDSLGNTISGVSVEQLIFSNELNRSYISPLPLENLNLYVIGMVKESNFQKIGLRINFDLISALLLFLFLLIASIPLLGIINLSKGDNLTQNKVIQSGISLMGLFLVIGFTVSTYKNKHSPIDEKTYKLAEEIRKSIYDTLYVKSRTLTTWHDDRKFEPQRSTFNELIGFDKTGFAGLLYFDDGKKRKNLVNYSGKKSAIDLSDRKYFRYFIDRGQPKKNYIQSHHSRGSGKLETVISTNFAPRATDTLQVKAITFNLEVGSMDSLKVMKNTDPSFENRFLVFKRSGGVIYSSKKIASPISKIQEGLSDAKWKEIEAIIQNNENGENIKLEVPIYLNGNQYIALIQRVDGKSSDDLQFDEPLWLMFLVNQNITNVFTSLASFEAVILMGIYFLFLVFSLFIKLITRKSTDKFGFKTFIYEGIKPVADNLNRLQYLTLVYLIIFVFIMILYAFVSVNHLEFLSILIFGSTLISLINLITQIDYANWEQPITLPLSCFSTAGFALLLFVVIASISSWSMVLYLLVAGGLAGAFCFYWFRRQRRRPLLFKKISAGRIFTFYLTAWFLVIGFLPGYIIHSKTYGFEKRIWDKEENDGNIGVEKINSFATYESTRRSMMFALSDPFDQRIIDFITPNHEQLQSQLAGQKEDLSFSYIFYILIFLVILGMLIHWIQTKIFFELEGDWEGKNEIKLDQKLLFLSSTNSKNIDKAVSEKFRMDDISPEHRLEFDLLRGMEDLETFQIDSIVSHIHIKNFHCLDNPMEIINTIFFLQTQCEEGLKIIVSSGKSWRDSANLIKEPKDRMRFSEFFSDFHFILLPLRSNSKETHAERDISSPEDYNDLMSKQRSRKAYLYNLWTELNFDEKIACYSFANEGFFNIARKDVLIELAQKGIIVPVKNSSEVKGSWKDWELFSAVFRKYILDNSTEDEIKSFQVYEKINGNAATIQVSAISFVLICFALIGIFDKNFFNEAYAYATGSLGILGTLYTVINRGLSNFNFGKKEA